MFKNLKPSIFESTNEKDMFYAVYYKDQFQEQFDSLELSKDGALEFAKDKFYNDDFRFRNSLRRRRRKCN